MKTNEPKTAIEITVRCKPWLGSAPAEHRVLVDEHCVRVWDPVAGHYTLAHSLSRRTERRICRLAMEAQS